MTSQKYVYADDLALLYASRNWKTVEDTLSQDMIPDLEAIARQYENGDDCLSS